MLLWQTPQFVQGKADDRQSSKRQPEEYALAARAAIFQNLPGGLASPYKD